MAEAINVKEILYRTLVSLLAKGYPEEECRAVLTSFGVNDELYAKLYPAAKARMYNAKAALPEASIPVELRARTLNDFLNKDVVKLPPLFVGPSGKALVSRPSLSQVHGYRGTGKSNISFDIARAVATGGQWLKFQAPEPLKTLYIEGEQPDADLQEQLQDLVGQCDNFWLMTMEEQDEKRFPKIATLEGQAAFETYLVENKIQFAVFDSLSTLANIPMNDEEEQIKIGDWFIHLRTALGISVLYLQHDGKTGMQRGHSKHEDWLNLSVGLSWPERYYGQEGLKVYLRFDKARRFSGDTEELLVQLLAPCEFGNDKPTWTYKKATETQSKRQAAAEMVRKILEEEKEISNNAIIDMLKEQKLSFNGQEMKEMVQQQRKLFEKGPNADEPTTETT
jgi:RecA-family ATPase